MTTISAPMILSSEERNLLYLAATGHSAAQSARALDMTLPRAEQVLNRLQGRLGVPTRSALITRAIVQRWV